MSWIRLVVPSNPKSPVQQAVNLAKSELKEQKVNKGVPTVRKRTRQTVKPKIHKGRSTKAKPVKPKKHKGRSTKAKPSQKKDIFSKTKK